MPSWLVLHFLDPARKRSVMVKSERGRWRRQTKAFFSLTLRLFEEAIRSTTLYETGGEEEEKLYYEV